MMCQSARRAVHVLGLSRATCRLSLVENKTTNIARRMVSATSKEEIPSDETQPLQRIVKTEDGFGNKVTETVSFVDILIKVVALDANLNTLTSRVDRLLTSIKERFEGVNEKIDKLEEKIDKKIDKLEEKIDAKFKEARNESRFFVGAMITLAGGLVMYMEQKGFIQVGAAIGNEELLSAIKNIVDESIAARVELTKTTLSPIDR